MSVLIAALMCVFASPVSRVFGANTEETLKPTVDYLVTLALGAPAHLLTLYLIPLLQLDEKKKLINAATIAMTVINVTLNIIFVLNDMGIKGIGYSTSISYYVALIILSSHFFGKKNGNTDILVKEALYGAKAAKPDIEVEFVNTVNRYSYEMDLRAGRHVVDAKSILGIFSLDLSKPISLEVYSDDCADLMEDIKRFMI